MQPGSTPNINHMFTRSSCAPSKIKDKQDLSAFGFSLWTAGTRLYICKHFQRFHIKKLYRAAIHANKFYKLKDKFEGKKRINKELTRFRRPRPSEQQVNRVNVSKPLFDFQTRARFYVQAPVTSSGRSTTQFCESHKPWHNNCPTTLLLAKDKEAERAAPSRPRCHHSKWYHMSNCHNRGCRRAKPLRQASRRQSSRGKAAAGLLEKLVSQLLTFY